jgi:hypothetical protein
MDVLSKRIHDWVATQNPTSAQSSSPPAHRAGSR